MVCFLFAGKFATCGCEHWIKTCGPLPIILPGRELKPHLAEVGPMLHAHLAQRQVHAGRASTGWRCQQSDRQGCVPSISLCLQLADLSSQEWQPLPATVAQSWQHLEPFPSSQSAGRVTQAPDGQGGGCPPQDYPSPECLTPMGFGVQRSWEAGELEPPGLLAHQTSINE